MLALFDNLLIKWKILIIVILPLSMSLYLSFDNILQANKTALKMEGITKLSETAVAASRLVHELQKERGRSSGFLNSKGAKFSVELSEQKKSTDKYRIQYNDAINHINFDEYDESLKTVSDKISDKLKSLADFRQSVESLTAGTDETVKYYTETIHEIIAIADVIAREASEDPKLANMIDSYKAFMEIKERNGVMRAALTGVFARKSFTPYLYAKVLELGAESRIYEEMFEKKANADIIQFNKITVTGNSVDESAKMLRYALENSDSQELNVSPDLWFSAISTKIDLMKQVEDKIAEDIVSNAYNLADIASNSRNYTTIVAFALLAATIALLIFSSRRIAKRLREAQYIAEQIASGNFRF